LACVLLMALAPSTFANEPADATTVEQDGRVVFAYRHAAAPKKPYIKELFTPAGVQVLRDAPADHLHHHGAMFAVAADGVSFWAEDAKGGMQRTSKEVAPSGAELQHGLEWIAPDAKTPTLVERRTLTAHAEPNVALLTWRTVLSPAGDQPVRLTGSHYYGLGIRFVQSMDEDGAFLAADESDREHVRGSEHLTRSKWMAYTAKADGKRVTVAVFDHPKNPRRPARMFSMTDPFAYLGATLNLWKEPLELKPGEELDLRYGLAAWDGPTDAKTIDALYRKWTELRP
jgi:hypothetical protein